MDIATIGGLVAGLALVTWGILSGSPLSSFIDPGSIVIVIGGTFAAIFVTFPLNKVFGIAKVTQKAFF